VFIDKDDRQYKGFLAVGNEAKLDAYLSRVGKAKDSPEAKGFETLRREISRFPADYQQSPSEKLTKEQFESYAKMEVLEKQVTAWEKTKEKIKKMLWWDDVAKGLAKLNQQNDTPPENGETTDTTTTPADTTPPATLSTDGKAWFIHPIIMLNLSLKKHPIILLNEKEYELIFLDQRGNMDLLTDSDYEEVANELGCETKALKAVGIKETKDQSFYTHLGDHVPKILFERHYFHKLTNGKYDNDPDISSKSPFTKYGSYAKQYERLIKAYALSPREALMSASWGKFQVMGANMHSDELSIEDILYKISRSEKNHLITLKGYLLKNKNALEALKSKKWDKFALYYNGSGYKKNNYDVHIKEIYEKL
jgi:hypothetical protein